MTNLSPNLNLRVRDKSLGSVPLSTGSVGFILPAQWGPVNKVLTVGSVKGGTGNLYDAYGQSIYNTNHITWATIAKYLNYGVGAAKVCRIASDDSTTKNSVKFVSADLTLSDWNNGTAQFRKLNPEDDSFPSIENVIVTLDADPSAVWTAGDTITGGTSSATGTVDAVILIAENSTATAFAYLKDVSGTFTAGETLTATAGSGTATIATAAGTIDSNTLYDTYFHQVRLTVGAGEEDKVGIGGTIADANGASGIVIGKDRSNHYLFVTSHTGTFTATALTTLDTITYAATPVTVSAVTETSAIQQVLMFYAKYPGTVGDTINVALTNRNDYSTATYSGTNKISDLFENTSLSEDEVAIVVTLDGTVVESHICSLDSTATLQGGKSFFIDDFLEDNSSYIGSVSVVDGAATVSDLDDLGVGSGSFVGTALSNGATGTVALQEAKDGYDELAKKSAGCRLICDFHELNDVSYYGDMMSYLQGLADAAKRFHFIGTMRKDDITPSSFNAATSIAASGYDSISSYYFIPYYEWSWYNNGDLKKKYYIPVTGDNAAIIIRTIEQYGDWKAPFGLIKGIMSNTTKLYYNLDEGSDSPVSELYKYGINANLFKEDAAGNQVYVVWGNRTKYNPSSDLSRINVSNALTTDMKKLDVLLQPFISEDIDQNTFDLIVNTVDAGYLANRALDAFDTLDGDGGYDFICDTSNNTAQTRKENKIIIDFKVKYKKAAEYIEANITVTAAGIDFELI